MLRLQAITKALLPLAMLVLLQFGVPLSAQNTQASDADLLRTSSVPVPESLDSVSMPIVTERSGVVPIATPGNNLESDVQASHADRTSKAALQTDAPEVDDSREGSTSRSGILPQHSSPPDFNRSIYYKNKFEFGLDVGWHPINIPFVYDVFVGDGYTMTPLKYTMVPVIASLRWQTGNIWGPWIFRGNFDLSFSGSITAIPRGPETRYFSFIFGIRRNFVPRHGKIAPYFDERGGIGNIDAKEPLGAVWAQGQNLTFTYNMGAGIRYNFNSKYSLSAGMNYMHVSNAYLSEPKYTNYGINVYGPMFGLNVRIGKPPHAASH